MVERCENHLHAFASRDLHRRHNVRIARDNDNSIDQAIFCHERDIEPDAKIHTFLPQHRLKIVCDNCAPLGNDLARGLVRQSPTVKRNFTESNRKIRFAIQHREYGVEEVLIA